MKMSGQETDLQMSWSLTLGRSKVCNCSRINWAWDPKHLEGASLNKSQKVVAETSFFVRGWLYQEQWVRSVTTMAVCSHAWSAAQLSRGSAACPTVFLRLASVGVPGLHNDYVKGSCKSFGCPQGPQPYELVWCGATPSYICVLCARPLVLPTIGCTMQNPYAPVTVGAQHKNRIYPVHSALQDKLSWRQASRQGSTALSTSCAA